MSGEAHFEVFPQRHPPHVPGAGQLAGCFCWHFRDANGRITFTGGESFKQREDAHRAIRGAAADVMCATSQFTTDAVALSLRLLPIIDLDEKGDELQGEVAAG